MNGNLEQFNYDNAIVKKFTYATILWGVVGMLVGLWGALELINPWFNFDTSWITFGRIRPLHTNAVIFAFVGNGIFMGVYYSLQRLLKARMYSDLLSNIHFWGWQLIIVSAAITFPLGFTTGKEYAELEWPIDLAIAVVWIIFGINMFGTILKRRERHLYVAIWFYIATWVTITILHVVNSVELPVGFLKSYPVYAGVQDALVQWWYGHNAVAFFLTTPYLGLMYYFIPKAANRPVYSYRLSIIHFWALVFIYIWAGPHHLLFTALPEWAQSLGTVFSVMLIAPSWGGMINGLLTLRGAWDKVRNEPELKFLVVAVTAYGMSTFEGPMLSIKWVNEMSHYTDWTIGHVHLGALGWNGFLTFGVLYWLVPKLWNTKIFSKPLANLHFWIGTLGIIFYVIPMYFGGFTQFLMWREFTPEGLLKYPNFLETLIAIKPMYIMRAVGGGLYLTGTVVMVFNLIQTMKAGSFFSNEAAEAPALKKETGKEGGHWHRWIEKRPIQMLLATLVLVILASVFELIPTLMIKSNIPTIASVKPYTPLELQGRDIYIREGCYNCHSQMIRPFRYEVMRYDPENNLYSMAGEFVYDHPFQWGSKRTGPDLQRVGGKYLDSWHFDHMLDPTSISPKSIMPSYPWLYSNSLDTTTTGAKIRAMQALGVPYEEGYDKIANKVLREQADAISLSLVEQKRKIPSDREIIALIAYLQRLGTDVKVKDKTISEKNQN